MNSKYLKDTIAKALEVINLSHTGAEAKEVIKDLVNITEQVESAVTERTSDGVDQRILQKRYEALKAEHRELQKKLEEVHSMLTSKIMVVIKALTTDVAHVSDAECANRLKGSIKQLIEVISKI